MQVTNLPELLAKIPDESKPMAALAIGAVTLVILVLLHGAGIHVILTIHMRGLRRLRKGRPRLFTAVILFGWAVFLMLCLHIGEFALGPISCSSWGWFRVLTMQSTFLPTPTRRSDSGMSI